MFVYILVPERDLRHRAHEHGQRLEGKTEVRVPGSPSLFEHTWKKEEHEQLARNILKDTATLGDNTASVAKLLSQCTTEEGIRMRKPFAPLLLLLESGIQRIKPGQLAMLVVLRIGAKTQTTTAVIRDNKDRNVKEVSLEVGSLLLLYGDDRGIGWELLESDMSFLHIPVPVEHIGEAQG